MIRPHAGERAFWLHVFEVERRAQEPATRCVTGETAAFPALRRTGIGSTEAA